MTSSLRFALASAPTSWQHLLDTAMPLPFPDDSLENGTIVGMRVVAWRRELCVETYDPTLVLIESDPEGFLLRCQKLSTLVGNTNLPVEALALYGVACEDVLSIPNDPQNPLLKAWNTSSDDAGYDMRHLWVFHGGAVLSDTIHDHQGFPPQDWAQRWVVVSSPATTGHERMAAATKAARVHALAEHIFETVVGA